MCRLAVTAKTDLQQQLGIVLQGNGKSQQAAVDLAKSFERRKCNHREAILGEECIASVIGKPFSFSVDVCSLDTSAGDSNKHRYVIATQSQTLRVKLRLVPAVPIVHVNRAVMILEPPSDVTLNAKQQACLPLKPGHASTNYRGLE
ncbi:Fcf1-domain-containing protein [Lanmaoa asiatica]|nr:Fcf1-domain-containing protein [Lanmaoa asiatica]